MAVLRIFCKFWFVTIVVAISFRVSADRAVRIPQEVNNVLVVVTRYFGGIHLGPDRFKHINQAARNALELGGFLDSVDHGRKGRGRKR